MAKDFTALFIGIIVMITLGLIGIHLYNAFSTGSLISTSPIIFYLIIGIISVAVFFLFKSTAAGAALNLNQIVIPLIIAGVLIFLIIKFPQLVPKNFSIAGQKAVGMLPSLSLVFGKREAGYER